MHNTIVITRHAALVEYLLEIGLIDADTPILPHVSQPEEVAGKTVIGPCPLHLAVRARSVVHIPIHWESRDERGLELTLEQVRERAGKPLEFKVSGEKSYLADRAEELADRALEKEYGARGLAALGTIVRSYAEEHGLVELLAYEDDGHPAISQDMAGVLVQLAALPPCPLEDLSVRHIGIHGGRAYVRLRLHHPSGRCSTSLALSLV